MKLREVGNLGVVAIRTKRHKRRLEQARAGQMQLKQVVKLLSLAGQVSFV